jgi:hypothetical protein
LLIVIQNKPTNYGPENILCNYNSIPACNELCTGK